MDKTFPKGEVLRCFAISNRSDRVYRNTWCNAGRQRTPRCTKDTFWNPFRIWREASVSAVCYIDRWNLVPSFFDDVMDGGIPPIPHMTSWYVTSRGLIWTIFKWTLALGDSQSDPELKKKSKRSEEVKRRKEVVKVSWSLLLIAWSHSRDWDTLMLCFRCISCRERV